MGGRKLGSNRMVTKTRSPNLVRAGSRPRACQWCNIDAQTSPAAVCRKLLNGAFALLGPRPFHCHVEESLTIGFFGQRHHLSASSSCNDQHAVQHPGLAALLLVVSPMFRSQLGLGLLFGMHTWRHGYPVHPRRLLADKKVAHACGIMVSQGHVPLQMRGWVLWAHLVREQGFSQHDTKDLALGVVHGLDMPPGFNEQTQEQKQKRLFFWKRKQIDILRPRSDLHGQRAACSSRLQSTHSWCAWRAGLRRGRMLDADALNPKPAVSVFFCAK